MPGFITHLSFGEQSLSFIESQEISGLINAHLTVYNLGLQGPDIFFYHLPCHLLHKHNIGNLMHRRNVMLMFDSLINGRNTFDEVHDRRICDAYIIGFIGHYSLDVACHPYVYFKSDHINNIKRNRVFDFGKHCSLETDIDHLVLKHYKHILPSQFDYAGAITPSIHEQQVVSELLYIAISQSFPADKVSVKTIKHAINSIIKLNKFMRDPTGKKKHKLRKLEQKLFKCCYLSGMIPSDTKLKYNDPCNNLHNPWHNPWYPLIPRTDSIFDIINKTMPIYIKRINMYINAVGNAAIETTDMDSVEETNYYLHNRNILLVELSDNSYLTGLPIK